MSTTKNKQTTFSIHKSISVFVFLFDQHVSEGQVNHQPRQTYCSHPISRFPVPDKKDLPQDMQDRMNDVEEKVVVISQLAYTIFLWRIFECFLSRKHTRERLPLAASGEKRYACQMVPAFCRSAVIHTMPERSPFGKKKRFRVDFISTAELAPAYTALPLVSK